MLHSLKTVLASLIPLLLLSSVPPQASIADNDNSKWSITSDTTIVVPEAMSFPIKFAVEDLLNDFRKVFGTVPKIVTQPTKQTGTTIIIGSSKKIEGPEAFSITAARNKDREIIRLTGADLRGTLYAIYQFSQDYLGVDPMYFWTDKEPEQKSAIEIPASITRNFPPPVFRYRGFFINDEDLLTGWAPGTKDKTGISIEVWNKIFETLLRLKANMVVPGTWVFPGEPQQIIAGERGLALSIHHATPLDLNVSRWPKGVPYNYTTHPEILEQAWKNAVHAFPKNQEILWELGLRGLSDESYASLDPAVRGNDQATGALISKAIEKQMEIVKAIQPDAVFVTNLWSEGARLMDKGFLKIPQDVITVWADNGWGWLQDQGKAKLGQGAYYHVAMYNFSSNQLSEMVPVDRIHAELSRFQSAGATNFLLVNTSDLRPVAMTAKAIMDFGWKGKDQVPQADVVYRDWARNEFGDEVAAEFPDLIKAYFAAPAKIKTANNSSPELEYGDMLYHYHAREFILSSLVHRPLFVMAGQAPLWRPPHILRDGKEQEWVDKTATADKASCEEAASRWNEVWNQAEALLAKVRADRKDYYRAEILTMIEINRQSNEMLLNVLDYIQAMKEKQNNVAKASLASAKDCISKIKEAEHWAEYGKWANWYKGDWLVGINRTAELIKAAQDILDDSNAPLPIGVLWEEREAYEHIMGYEGDRSVDLTNAKLPEVEKESNLDRPNGSGAPSTPGFCE